MKQNMWHRCQSAGEYILMGEFSIIGKGEKSGLQIYDGYEIGGIRVIHMYIFTLPINSMNMNCFIKRG
jgi:hypothetical protein